MAAPSWAPSADQVAAVLRTRTRGREGIAARSAMEQGRFTAATRPTLTAVLEIIELACGEVLASFEGREPCSPATEAAARTAALYAACQTVEVSYWAETRGEGSTVEAFDRKVERLLSSTSRAVIARCPFSAGEDPAENTGALAPSGRGPRQPLIGRNTVW